MHHGRRIALGAVLALLTTTGSASAATISFDFESVSYTGGDEANDVTMTVSRDGDSYVYDVLDAAGVEIETSSPQCTVGPAPGQARCVLDFQPGGSFDGGLGNDTFRTVVGPGLESGFFFSRSSPGNDAHLGGAGLDLFFAGSAPDGADTFVGDSVNYSQRGAGVNVTLAGGADDGESGEQDDIRATRIEGTSFGDTLVGTDASESLNAQGVFGDDGAAGFDDVAGGGGVDELFGEGRIDGGAGADTVSGSRGPLLGGEGNDELSGTAELVDGGPGDDTIRIFRRVSGQLLGGTGVDTVDAGFDDSSGPVSLSIDGEANDGFPGDTGSVGGDVENLRGTEFADVLIGGDGPNVLTQNNPGGELAGRGGDDVLVPGAGFSAETISGGSGSDRVDYSGAQQGVRVSLTDGPADDGIAGRDEVASDVEDVTATPFDDVLVGSGAANRLLAGAGEDELSGGAGDDTLDGAGGGDTVVGGPGLDTITGGAANDDLDGGVDADAIDGGAGADTLNGDDGDDTILGGLGADIIDSGLGLDDVAGGDGPDDLRTRDTLRDTVGCGLGTDRLLADVVDVVAADCEDPGTAGAPGAGGSAGTPGVDGTPGTDGANGTTGASGASGVAGTPGVAGPAGPAGATSVVGAPPRTTPILRFSCTRGTVTKRRARVVCRVRGATSSRVRISVMKGDRIVAKASKAVSDEGRATLAAGVARGRYVVELRSGFSFRRIAIRL